MRHRLIVMLPFFRHDPGNSLNRGLIFARQYGKLMLEMIEHHVLNGHGCCRDR